MHRLDYSKLCVIRDGFLNSTQQVGVNFLGRSFLRPSPAIDTHGWHPKPAGSLLQLPLLTIYSPLLAGLDRTSRAFQRSARGASSPCKILTPASSITVCYNLRDLKLYFTGLSIRE